MHSYDTLLLPCVEMWKVYVKFVNVPINNSSLKLTPFNGCKFHAFLQRQRTSSDPGNSTGVWYVNFYGQLLIHTTYSHRLSIVVIRTVKTDFDNLPLKRTIWTSLIRPPFIKIRTRSRRDFFFCVQYKKFQTQSEFLHKLTWINFAPT